MSGKTPSEQSTRPSGKTEPLKLKLKSTKVRLVKEQQQRTDDRVAELKRSYDQTTVEIERKGWKRSPPERTPEHQSSASTESGFHFEPRKGRGVIDRFEFDNKEQHLRQKRLARRKTAPRTVQEIAAATARLNSDRPSSPQPWIGQQWVGPQSGLPPPRPDPRWTSHPEPQRTSRVVTEKSTWTGVVVRDGVFEWSRANSEGYQEWLSAKEEKSGEWTVTRSKATKR